LSETAFVSDLRAAREARGTTLEQIQQRTRIPTDVLRRFEDGHLLGDPTYNDVYLRAFLKSYAEAVGLPAAEVIAGLDAERAGRYDGRLHPDYVVPPSAPPRREPAAPSGTATPGAETPPAGPPVAPTAPPPATASAAPAVEALRTAPPAPPPAPRPVAGSHVRRPAVPSAKRSFDKNWGTILALFATFVVLLGAALWALVFRDDTPDEAPTAETAGTDETGAPAGEQGGEAASGPTLTLPLRVTVTAGGDGLQGFRVTADGDDRRPYWVEPGNQQAFQADSLLILWGEGETASFDDASLEMQGLTWTPPSGRPLRLSAASGQALLDSLAGTR
jgi:hypothetical protein